MSGGNKGDQVQVKIRGNILSHPVYSNGTNVAAIQRGTMVNINAGGFAIQASDTANETFAGISEEAVAAKLSNQALAPNIRVRRRGIFKMKLDTSSKATAPTLVGELVYVNTAQGATGGDDELVGLSTYCATGHVLVGMIVKHGTDAQAKAAEANVVDVWVDIMGVGHSVLGDALYVALDNLLAMDAAKGAHLVGVHDTLDYFAVASETVELVLAELRNRTATLMSATGNQDITMAMQHKGVILVPNTAALELDLITPDLASEKGLTVTVVKTNDTADVITITTEGAEQIDGSDTYTALDAQYDTATFIWDGAAWNVSDFGEIYAKLALTTASNGASLIGIQDAADEIVGETVEAALAELASNISTVTGASPTITAAQFNGRLVELTNAGAVTAALPATDVTVGMICRFVKANVTAGILTITGTTLVGPQCSDGSTTDEFNGCGNDGDSVLIQCVGANSYRVIDVTQQVAINAVDTDRAVTALEFISGYVTTAYAGAQAISLPGDSVPVGTKCVFERLHESAVTISATALTGGQASGTSHATCNAVGDTVTIMCTTVDNYMVVAEATSD